MRKRKIINNKKFDLPDFISRVERIDYCQATRMRKLLGVALEIAVKGIRRHLQACDRMDIPPDAGAIREIIDDALSGNRIFECTSDDRKFISC